MKRIAVVLSFVLAFNSGLVANAAVKSGTACKKLGITSTVSGIKFTCIKSGSKLIWNKGVKVKSSTPTPSAKPSTSAKSQPDLSEDLRITNVSQLSNPQICKTIDLTERNDVNNGFPRSSAALQAPSLVKILILPINLADVPFTDSDLSKVKSAVDKTSEIYKTISYGKLKMEFTIPEKSEWVTLNKTADSYGIVENKPQQNNEIVVIDAIAASSSKINFDLYDGVIVETGFFKSSGGGQGFPGQKYPTAHGTAKGVSFEFGTGVGQWQTIAHEFGHSLFFLEDLYVFLNSNRPSVPDPLPAGRWDMMSSSEPTFFGWSRLLMGYLEDSEFRCVSDQKESTHYLTNIDSKTGNKLVLLNIKEGRTLAMEARTAYDSNQGLLVYEIDSSINHGDGPIKAQKKLLYEGDLLTVLGYAITVKASDKKGLLFSLTKLI